jgi:hypothetical protein
MPSQDHVHKYKKVKLGRGYIVYRCVLPDCTHYLSAKHVVGQKNICWVCGKPHVVYTDSNGVLARPHCKTCTKSSKKQKKDDDYDFPIPMILP